ncbi:MAG: hypothetical protein RMJ98_00555 [Myxococcales bacterium]|nr:hypothetical protein [Polyangiaceae bacterium]MDW8247776.1 hypothetical protein [Myxococcales bacterium]
MTFYERLRRLLEWRGEPGIRVLSLYLDIVGPGEERAISAAETLWEEAKAALDDDTFFDRVEEILDELPQEIVAAQTEGYDGLALFFCPNPPLREIFRLRFAFENQIEVSHEPQTWQLAYYEEEYEQALAVSLGSTLEVAEIHVGDVVARHLVRPSHGRTPEQEASTVVHRLLHDSPGAHLILLGSPEHRATFEDVLEPELRARIIGVSDEPLLASDPSFLRAIHRIQQAYERRSEAEGVRALLAARENETTASMIAAGSDEVVAAVNRGSVRKFYILQGFSECGWLCDACDRMGLLPVPPACVACGASVAKVELRPHLIQHARACGAEIETVLESEALENLGGVAAELHGSSQV